MPEPPPILDSLQDSEKLRAWDPLGMLDLVLRFPEQCREAVRIGAQPPREPVGQQEVHQVVVTALGGSAIGADFARCLMDEYGKVPLIVNRDYVLPHWIGTHSLVIAASYSGNTEETIAAYQAAVAANAQIAAVTSGGKIRAFAEPAGFPVMVVPGGQPPRSATGYMFFPMLAYLGHRGLLRRDMAADVDETLTLLEQQRDRLGPQVPLEQNPAKQLATALYGKIPIVYGSQGYRGAVAIRWKGQFNENAKLAAFANVLPEQNHNEILAWTLAPRQATNWAAIFLRDPVEMTEMPRIARRVEVTKNLIASAAEIHEVWAEGNSMLARMFSLITFADYLTVYLAFLNEVCPTDIAGIDHLKAEMAKL